MRLRALTLALLCVAAPPALAAPIALALPEGAQQTDSRAFPATSLRLPTGPQTDAGGPAAQIEGARADTAWRIRDSQATTLQLLAPLRAQIAEAGYRLIYECADVACGGFDFRFSLDLIPEPEMHVDLGDFRYLAARKGDDWLALTVSRSSVSGFVHLTTVAAMTAPPTAAAEIPQTTPQITPQTAPQTMPPAEPQQSDFAQQLETQGGVALDDLVFASGATALEDRDYASLRALASYLAAHPKAHATLVGHSDATGPLGPNLAVSKQRAEAAMARLTQAYGVAPAQISAEGVGWLAPRAGNMTPEGRERNRRVEAVLSPAD